MQYKSSRIGHTGLTEGLWHRPYSIASFVERTKVRVARLYWDSQFMLGERLQPWSRTCSDKIRVNLGGGFKTWALKCGTRHMSLKMWWAPPSNPPHFQIQLTTYKIKTFHAFSFNVGEDGNRLHSCYLLHLICFICFEYNTGNLICPK